MKFPEAEGAYKPEGQSCPSGKPSTVSHWVALLRALRLTSHVLYGLLLACFYPLLRLPMRQRLMQYWAGTLLKILHVQLQISGQPPFRSQHGAMLVANHISWLDVFIVNASSPSNFVAKSEVRSWPLFGLLSRLTLTIFIKRDIRRDALRANREIADMIGRGECVALFPEGTSSDGSSVRHFHSALMQCAIDTGTGVHPVAIRYHDVTGRRSSTANFIDDMTLLNSLQNVLCSPSLHATLVFLPKIDCAGKNRRVLGGEAQAAIALTLDQLDSRVESCAMDTRPQEIQNHLAPSSQSMYSLLLETSIAKLKRRTNP
jgi:1-acyl-sn-glycerol-3-phosphate acyltransferase